MLNEEILLGIYGCVLIASFFMTGSCGMLAWGEAKTADGRDLRHNTLFMIAISLVGASVALIIISGIRVYDGFSAFPIGGRWPWTMVVAMTLLFVSKAGFHWAATLSRPRWTWRLFVFAIVLWSLFWTATEFSTL